VVRLITLAVVLFLAAAGVELMAGGGCGAHDPRSRTQELTSLSG